MKIILTNNVVLVDCLAGFCFNGNFEVSSLYIYLFFIVFMSNPRHLASSNSI